jgi:hypothetical protein
MAHATDPNKEAMVTTPELERAIREAHRALEADAPDLEQRLDTLFAALLRRSVLRAAAEADA